LTITAPARLSWADGIVGARGYRADGKGARPLALTGTIKETIMATITGPDELTGPNKARVFFSVFLVVFLLRGIRATGGDQ
jgi:hypothetical protein